MERQQYLFILFFTVIGLRGRFLQVAPLQKVENQEQALADRQNIQFELDYGYCNV